MEIVIRNFLISLKVILKHFMGLFLCLLENGEFFQAWLVDGLPYFENDARQICNPNSGCFPSLFDLSIFYYQFFPGGKFVELIIALIDLSKKTLGGKCRLLIFQFVHEMGQSWDLTKALKLLGFDTNLLSRSSHAVEKLIEILIEDVLCFRFVLEVNVFKDLLCGQVDFPMILSVLIWWCINFYALVEIFSEAVYRETLEFIFCVNASH